MKWKMVALYLLVVALSTAYAGEPTDSGLFPVIDAHAHLGRSFKFAQILEDMDKNGVSKQIVRLAATPAATLTCREMTSWPSNSPRHIRDGSIRW